MVDLVLDTNVYLHARFFTELPWNELVHDEVCLIVPRMVLRELDEVKYGAKPEVIKQRAAAVVRRFAELKKASPEGSHGDVMLVRKSVTLRFHMKAPDFDGGELSRDNQDDHVLATCLSARATLCSADVGFILKAESHGVTCVELPANWMEPARVDPAQKELERYRNRTPKLEPIVSAQGVTLSEGAELEVFSLRPARSDEVMSLALERAEANARRRRGNRSHLADSWDAEWGRDEAEDRERQEFERLQRSIYDEVDRCAIRAREIRLDIRLRNGGTVPASEIEVDVAVDGTAEIVDSRLPMRSPRIMHNREDDLGTVTLRFPRDFQAGGVTLRLTVHAAELPKPVERRLNLKIRSTGAGPFHGMTPD